MKTISQNIVSIIANREEAALCTVVKTTGSTPAKAGAKMLVWADGRSSGTIGGGALEKAAENEAVQIIHAEKAQLFTHHLVKDHAMCCGGSVEVFIEAIPIPYQLFIFGAGHVGAALAKHAEMLNFQVILIDGREGIFGPLADVGVEKIMQAPVKAFRELEARIDKRSLITIATHDHALDRKVLSWALGQTFAYVGMIGSKRKALVTRKLFVQNGITDEAGFDAVDVPMGIDIKAHTPAEIAISILGKLIAIRNGAGGEVQQQLDPNFEGVDACVAGIGGI